MQRHLFPLEFTKILVVKESDYTQLAKAMSRRGYRLSKQFIHSIAHGNRKVPATQLKRICEVLQLSQDERKKLHRAACLDQGFEIGDLDA